jgi:chemotaxis protein CheD
MNSELTTTYHLEPGYLYISKNSGIIRTVIGSCVAVCMWDTSLFIGGMCSIIRAKTPKGEKYSSKDAGPAIKHLTELLEKEGCKRENLSAQIFGGSGKDFVSGSTKCGIERAKEARRHITKNKIAIASEDVGGSVGRKILFDTHSGHVMVAKVHDLRENDWF